MRSAEGLPRLKALMKHWLGWTKRAGLPGGCPVAAAMFELDDVEGPVRDWVLSQEKQWRDFLRHNVEQAVTRGQLKPDLDTEQFVWEMCGIYLAHHVAYRFVRARDADQRAEIAFEALLVRARPEEKARKSKKRSPIG